MGLFHHNDKTAANVAGTAPQTYPATITYGAPQIQPQAYQPQDAPPAKGDKKKTKGFVKWTFAFLGAGA